MRLPATPITAPAALPARVLDALLELSVVGSWSRLGPLIRAHLGAWSPPARAEGRQVVVTGATSGLGLAAAATLVRLGASVCVVGRDPARTESTRHQIEGAGPGRVSAACADLGDLSAVADLARRLESRLDRLDALLHVAGSLSPSFQRSAQGIELTVAVHVLAPYLLTEQLRPQLAAAPSPRVITMTSGGMYLQPFSLDQLELTPRTYRPTLAYARAKRAQVVLTQEWQRRYGPTGIAFHCVHPGWVDTPGLRSALPRFARTMGPVLRTPDQGADTAVWLATTDGAEGGRLWLDRRPRRDERLPGTWRSGSQCRADGAALWRWCEERIGGGRGEAGGG